MSTILKLTHPTKPNCSSGANLENRASSTQTDHKPACCQTEWIYLALVDIIYFFVFVKTGEIKEQTKAETE